MRDHPKQYASSYGESDVIRRQSTRYRVPAQKARYNYGAEYGRQSIVSVEPTVELWNGKVSHSMPVFENSISYSNMGF